MGRRSWNKNDGKGKEKDEYPQLVPKTGDEVPLRGGPWYLRETDDAKILCCEIYLNAFASEGMSDNTRRTHWRLLIVRKTSMATGKVMPSKSFEARIGLHNGSEAMIPPIGFFRAQCNGWLDAIHTVVRYAPIVGAIRKLGCSFYGEEARERWKTVRPMRVVYPWKDSEEPNARYSPFTFLGATFDAEQDGAIVMSYGGSTIGSATIVNEAHSITSSLGGNAFLHGPVNGKSGEPEYHLYHRDYMRSYDVIDIDDWRARVIAGTGDDF
jgi:hypothetical protein